jgi:hypothetical protein
MEGNPRGLPREGRTPFKPQTVLLRLETDRGQERTSGVSQEATGAVLGEPGFA